MDEDAKNIVFASFFEKSTVKGSGLEVLSSPKDFWRTNNPLLILNKLGGKCGGLLAGSA